MIEMEIPCKAFSINAAYYRTRAVKTAECRAWEAQVLEYLAEYKELFEIGEDHKKAPATYALELDFIYPDYIFYNKSGEISSKTFDLSNVEKLLIDLIFEKTMGVNDKFVVSLLSRKMAGPVHLIRVRLKTL